jgi:hypothetical protein
MVKLGKPITKIRRTKGARKATKKKSSIRLKKRAFKRAKKR